MFDHVQAQPFSETLSIGDVAPSSLKDVYNMQSTVEFGLESTRAKNQTQQNTYIDAAIWGQASWSKNLSGIYDLSVKANSIAETQSGTNDRPRRADSAIKFKFKDLRPVYRQNRLELSGLVVSQKNAGISDFWDDRGQLGLFESIEVLSSEQFRVSLSAFQGQFMGYDGIVGASSLPQLYSESLRGERKTKTSETQIHTTYFRLRNADGEIAHISRDYGNDVIGVDEDSSRFTNPFNGYSFILSQKFIDVVGATDVLAGAEYLQNSSGRRGARESVIYKAQFEWPNYLIQARVFEIGEQAMPSALLKSPWNRVNVDGVSLQGQMLWQGFLLSATWIRLEPILEKFLSPKEQIIYLQLEKSFEIL